MTKRRITKPALPTNAQISKFINKCIKERLVWVASPDGIKTLGLCRKPKVA